MSITDIFSSIHHKYLLKKYSSTYHSRLPDSYVDTSQKLINSKNISSNTKYLICVDTKSFRVNIFTGTKNKWTFVKNFICSLGKPSTPTPLGTYKIGAKGYSFGQNHGYICYYYSQFKGNYVFHSILYNLNNTVRDGRLGIRICDGCIRLAKVNAKWIYDNVPYGTTVYIS